MNNPLSVATEPVGTNDRTAASAKPTHPLSPTQSDRSSDSEGRPVREKLKETRIDAQGTLEQAPSSDQPMKDAAVNGNPPYNSTSGSDSDRGRLSRKRSREDLGDEAEETKPQGKKHERHVRKKSRDFTSPLGSDTEITTKKTNGSIATIAENDGESSISSTIPATNRASTPEPVMSDNEGGTMTSPKNKRKLEQTVAGTDAAAGPSQATAEVANVEGRDTKRPRDGADLEASSQKSEVKPVIPAGSGFSNTSSTSPFATVSPKKSTDASESDLPQTSDKAFKNSGFGAFASSTASPFAATGNSGAKSPFGAATGNKLSSFASKPAASSSTSGFASLGGAASSFASAPGSGKSVFGGALGGSAFGNIGGTKPALSSFGAGGSITGLENKSAAGFGAAETKEASDDEGDEHGANDQGANEGDNESEGHTSHPLLSTSGVAPETGEENEDALWTGRAKLYTLAGPAGKKSWQERGVGPLRLNVSREAPMKARFVLRADGTHRLLLNASVTTHFTFGDVTGNEPKDGKLMFTAPTASGEVESHILKLKVDRAIDLWREVDKLKKLELSV